MTNILTTPRIMARDTIKIIQIRKKYEELEHTKQTLMMMELNCNEMRDVINRTATLLTSRIADYQRRLVDEVESFRDDEYNRRRTTRGRFADFAKEMAELADSAGVSATSDVSSYQLNYVNYLEEKLGAEKLFSPGRNSRLVFCSVKCNTVFGTLAVSLHTKTASHQEPRRRPVTAMSPARPRSHTWHSKDSKLMLVLKKTIKTKVMSVCLGSACVELLWKVAREGSAAGEVSCPNDVIFLDDSTIVVTEKNNCRLQRFDSRGKSIGLLAEGKITPSRIALNKDGTMVVTDAHRKRVAVVDRTGDVIGGMTKIGSKNEVRCPRGIAVNGKGQYVISDGETHKVTIHDREGQRMQHVRPAANLEFMNPSYISIGMNDRIQISDNWQQQVFIFDKNGSFLFELSNARPEGVEELQFPNGICIGELGSILVANWGNHTVSEFSSRGKFLGFVLTRGDGLCHPAGISYRNGCLAVTETSDRHSSVSVYRLTDRKK